MQRNKRSTRAISILSLLLALALVASACGSDSDSATGVADSADNDSFFDDDESSNRQRNDDSVDTSGDAEDRFADPAQQPDESDASSSDEQAMEEGESGGSLAPSERSFSDADDGFFEPVPEKDYNEQEEIDVQSADYGIRGFVDTDDDPESTFALDVDTGSYSIARRYLEDDQLPPADSVRVEEYVNSFDYDYDDPDERALGISIDGGPSPFDDDNYLVRIGIQAERVDEDDRPDAHLTFVVDTSGSMDRPDRLGLVKESLILLVDQLDRSD
ncbi:MAG: von Willebrand factor type A domain-containing protein, partial [Acidimicrobiales bacterium]